MIRRAALILALCLGSLGAVGAAPAAAAPVWNLELHHNPTNFSPGTSGQYWLDLDNVGTSASSGPVSFTVELPVGITSEAVIVGEEFMLGPQLKWSCTGETGASIVECESEEGSVPRHAIAHLILEVGIEAGLPEEELSTTATLEGGGAEKVASDSEPTPISPTPAGFGILESSFAPGFFAADGLTPAHEAGGHPDLLTVPVDFNSIPAPIAAKPAQTREAETIRDLRVDLPPGFVGAPTAVGECTQAAYTVGACPPSSQVGRFDGSVYSPAVGFAWNFSVGVFNLTHPRGAVTDLGFELAGNPVHVKVSLDPARNYAVTSVIANINETAPPFSGKVTIWGVPTDPSHDSERCAPGSPTAEECEHPRKPFLTLPSNCEAENVFRWHEYDSWQHPGLPNANPEVDHALADKMTGCEKPRFEPEVRIEPTGRQAATPTGIDVDVHVPQNQSANAQATPPVKDTTVTLPAGMTVNPAFADGLAGCSEAQFGISPAGVPNDNPIACPDSSRIGEVSLEAPLLPKPAEGSMYLARQEENPFGSLLALYLALHDTEERGVLVKVPLKVSLDPVTGQITTSALQTPQLPFEDLTLKFRSGPRAPLVNPPSCGPKEIEATISSWARPEEALGLSNSYQVSEGPGGAPCPPSASQRPFDPQLIAGTQNPVAGAFSPLALRVYRSDADQELSSVEGTAPPGLLASLRGVGRCSEAQIAAAKARSHPGEGATEIASPSCPAASQIGTLQAGAGAGPNPIYVPGKVYLAGPYKGAPLSGVAIVPAVAGPVDLGVVVVRAPAFVNPKTAQVRIVSDPLPQIVNGVLVRTRDVRVHLDRPGFALNPTSCAPKAIEATLHSTEGAIKLDSERFQVGDCGNLGFKPSLGLKLIGGTKRGSHPALRGTYTPRTGDANLKSLVLRFPHSAFLDQAHIRTICTRVQFAAGGGNGEQCPTGSVYGHVTAYTPLLDEPLQGPAFLRSSDHNLPDLVFALHGTIDVEASARIDSKSGGIRASFEGAPDAPLEKVVVEMQGGAKGLIVNSTNLCKGRHLANAQMEAQSGKRSEAKPAVRAKGCGRPPGAKHRHRGA
jgi:hypothetical protein